MISSPTWAAAPTAKKEAAKKETAARVRSSSSAAVKGQARELRDKGIVAVNLGRYEDAVNLLEQAYELSREPTILFDLVQAHRLNGNPERALVLCASFLRTAPAISPRNREQVERTVAELGIIVEEIQLQGKRGSRPLAPSPSKVAGKDKVAAAAVATETEPARADDSPPAEQEEKKAEAKPDDKSGDKPVLAASAPLPVAGSAMVPDRSAELLRADVQARAIDSNPRPFYRRPWVWAAAGVVVAGAVTAIVYQAGRDPGPPRTTWGSAKVF
jgi:hypothetical protein